MKILEQNITNSFRLAKNDIMSVQKEMISMSQNQEKLMEMIDMLRTTQIKLNQRINDIEIKINNNSQKKVTKRKSQTFVAAKSGKDFHTENCPFAQNILPKNKVKFKSKNSALNDGYKPCDCISK